MKTKKTYYVLANKQFSHYEAPIVRTYGPGIKIRAGSIKEARRLAAQQGLVSCDVTFC